MSSHRTDFFCQSQKFLEGHIVRSVYNWCEYVCSVLSRRWRILGWILTFILSPSRYGLALLWSPEVADDCVLLTTFHVDTCTLKEASKQVLSHQCILLPSVSVKKTVERLCDVFRDDDALWAQMPKAHPVSIRSAWWDNSVTLNQTQTSSSEQKLMTPPYPSYCNNTTQNRAPLLKSMSNFCVMVAEQYAISTWASLSCLSMKDKHETLFIRMLDLVAV